MSESASRNGAHSIRDDLLRIWPYSVLAIVISSTLSFFWPSHKFESASFRFLSDVLGYLYTTAWSVSFYPQLMLNAKTRSVAGLSLDFQMLNLLGFSCYSAYNLALIFSDTVQREYVAEFGSNIPVGPADVLFSVHAAIVTAATLAQCFVYERGQQRFLSPVGCACILAAAAAVISAVTVAVFEAPGTPLSWINLLIALSLIKLVVSLTKYIPQVWLNHRRQSTVGWNVYNVILDFTGGLLSLLQVLLDCGVTGDWHQISGNPVKFGLGFTSIFFDAVFFTQHYVLFAAPSHLYQAPDAELPDLAREDEALNQSLSPRDKSSVREL